MESRTDVREISIKTEEVDGEILHDHVVVETPSDLAVSMKFSNLQRVFNAISTIMSVQYHKDIKLRLATPAAVEKLRVLGVVAPRTKTSLVQYARSCMR